MLIAVLVLAIGILGVAGLQTRALVNGGDAMNRSMATVALYSIVDSMRADLAAARAGDYNGTVSADACQGSGSFAQNQLTAWCTSLATQLGAVSTTQGTIACDGTGLCTISLQWDDQTRAGAGGGVQILQTHLQLPPP